MEGAGEGGDHRAAGEGVAAVREGGEVRDDAQRAGGVEGGDELPQAALVACRAEEEEQQPVLRLRRDGGVEQTSGLLTGR